MIINGKIKVLADKRINRKIYSSLWKEFSFHNGAINFTDGKDLEFLCGKNAEMQLNSDDEFAFKVTDDGFIIKGADINGLRKGINVLAARIECKEAETYIPNGEIHGKFTSPFRAVHYCVFPETTLFETERFLKAAAVMCYTHIVVEFWGTLRYDALRCLGFKKSFSKKQLKKVFNEAKALGVEIIPFFNHLGHASQGRVISGKHVVLDQKPEYARLFTPDGWAFRIDSKEVKELLKKIRRELYELCGEGEYFHLGCDEAYIYNAGYSSYDDVSKYVAQCANEVVEEGRRPIIWADQLVPAYFTQHAGEIATYVPTEEDNLLAASFAKKLPKQTVLADWWYGTNKFPVSTCEGLKKFGFEILGCPFDWTENIEAYHKTPDLKGVLLTTWHILSQSGNYKNLLYNARLFGYPHNEWSKFSPLQTETAKILRAVKKPKRYEETGFCTEQITKNLLK